MSARARELMLMTYDPTTHEYGYPGDPAACSVETEEEGRAALRNLVEACPEYRDCVVLVEIRRNCRNANGRPIGTLYNVLAAAQVQVCR